MVTLSPPPVSLVLATPFRFRFGRFDGFARFNSFVLVISVVSYWSFWLFRSVVSPFVFPYISYRSSGEKLLKYQ